MNFDEYQEQAMRLAGDHKDPLTYGCLGLAGEAGEVIELVKKHVGHGHDLHPEKLLKELGDVLWYLTYLCNVSGIPLEVVAAANLTKLNRRYPQGFSPEASKARTE